MLDFFSIFSRGGILLWCFKGAGLLEDDWKNFRPSVNAFIKTVILQVRKQRPKSWLQPFSRFPRFFSHAEFSQFSSRR